MTPSFSLAQLIDMVIAFTLVECLLLAGYHRITGQGVALRDLLPNIGAGLCLMLALRCLARDTGSASVMLFLMAAGVAHGGDLLMRWRRCARGASVTATPSTPSKQVTA